MARVIVKMGIVVVFEHLKLSEEGTWANQDESALKEVTPSNLLSVDWIRSLTTSLDASLVRFLNVESIFNKVFIQKDRSHNHNRCNSPHNSLLDIDPVKLISVFSIFSWSLEELQNGWVYIIHNDKPIPEANEQPIYDLISAVSWEHKSGVTNGKCPSKTKNLPDYSV